MEENGSIPVDVCSGNVNDWFEALSVLLRFNAKTRLWFAMNVLYPACLQMPAGSEHGDTATHVVSLQTCSSPLAKPLSPYYRFLEFFFECPLVEVAQLSNSVD